MDSFQDISGIAFIHPNQKTASKDILMNKICIIGFNPAWQKTLFFPEFKKGSVNRARSAASMAFGKGLNAARAVRNWGKAVPCVYQFAGGTTGQKLLNYLNEEGICHCTREIAARTRTCTT